MSPFENPSENSAAITIEVFWRPGCPYCASLRRGLAQRGIDATWRNIWEDEQARAQVRGANGGNETVPTVRVGTKVLSNPSSAHVAQLAGHSCNEQGKAETNRGFGRRLLSWAPTVALIFVSVSLARDGLNGISWGADLLAIAAWWFTRPLRR